MADLGSTCVHTSASNCLTTSTFFDDSHLGIDASLCRHLNEELERVKSAKNQV